MRSRVVVTHRIHSEVLNFLSESADVVANESTETWPREKLAGLAREADSLMVFMPDHLDDAFLANCPRLKIVSGALKGYDNFDVDACTRRGIWFSIVPDLLTEPTAELALALTLALARNVLAGDEAVRGGPYPGWRPILYGRSIRGSTVGIVGFGAVGRALARMLEGFGCTVAWSDANLRGGCSFEELLESSDFVIPLVPLTPATLHLFNGNALNSMKPGSFLINVCRGSVVDEEAVGEALESGRLAGYAADTFEMEDWARQDRPRSVTPRLLALKDRTLFTPHLGSAVASVRLEIERAAALNIVQALRGEKPVGAVNLTDATGPRW